MDSVRDSMRMWWRFAPGAAGFAIGAIEGVEVGDGLPGSLEPPIGI